MSRRAETENRDEHVEDDAPGPDPALAAIEAAVVHAAAGAPTLAVVSGGAPEMRAALVRAARATIEARRGHLGVGRCTPNDVPHAALRNALAAIATARATGDSDARAAWKRRLDTELGALAGALTELVPELAPLLAAPAPLPALDPIAHHRRLRLAVRRLAAALASAEAPIVLVLDNAHAAERATLTLVDAMLSVPDAALLVLAMADAAPARAHAARPVGETTPFAEFCAATAAEHGRWRVHLEAGADETGAPADASRPVTALGPARFTDAGSAAEPPEQWSPARLFAVANELLAVAPGEAAAARPAPERRRRREILRAAGDRALRVGAYETAARIFAGATAVIDAATWAEDQAGCFAVELGLANAEFLAGRASAGETVFDILAERRLPPLLYGEAIEGRVALLIDAGETAKAVAVGRAGLAKLGAPAAAPSTFSVRLRRGALHRKLRRHADEDLVVAAGANEAVMARARLIETMAPALAATTSTAAIHLTNLRDHIESGLPAAAAFAREALAVVADPKQTALADRFVELATALEARVPEPRHGPRTRVHAAAVSAWRRPAHEVAATLAPLVNACDEVGDAHAADAAASLRIGLLVCAGTPLGTIRTELAASVRRAADGAAALVPHEVQTLALVDLLRDDATAAPFGTSASGREDKVARQVALTRRLPLLYVLGRAIDAFALGEGIDLLQVSPGHPLALEHTFWHGLAAAAVAGTPGPHRARAQAAFTTARARVEALARVAPALHGARRALLSAEHALLRGRIHEALTDLNDAAAYARRQELVHLEAIAHERHAELARTSGAADASASLRAAIAAYERWGAAMKCRTLGPR